MTEDENRQLDQFLEELYGDDPPPPLEHGGIYIEHDSREVVYLIGTALYPTTAVFTSEATVLFGLALAELGAGKRHIPVATTLDAAAGLIATIEEHVDRQGLLIALRAAVDGARTRLRLAPNPPLS